MPGALWALVEAVGGEGTTAFAMLVADPRVTWRVRSRRGQRRFGQEAVQLIGDSGTPVHRVAIGTGAITPLFGYVHDFEQTGPRHLYRMTASPTGEKVRTLSTQGCP